MRGIQWPNRALSRTKLRRIVCFHLYCLNFVGSICRTSACMGLLTAIPLVVHHFYMHMHDRVAWSQCSRLATSWGPVPCAFDYSGTRKRYGVSSESHRESCIRRRRHDPCGAARVQFGSLSREWFGSLLDLPSLKHRHHTNCFRGASGEGCHCKGWTAKCCNVDSIRRLGS